MENKPIITAEGKKLSKNVFIILLICGILLVIIGGALAILEIADASQLNDDIIMQYVIEGVAFAALGVLILIFAAPFRKRSDTLLHIYESHVMAKWLLAKEAVKVEYSQIVDIKTKGRGRIDVQLGAPFNKSAFSTLVVFRLDDKNAQDVHKILIDRKGVDSKSQT